MSVVRGVSLALVAGAISQLYAVGAIAVSRHGVPSLAVIPWHAVATAIVVAAVITMAVKNFLMWQALGGGKR